MLLNVHSECEHGQLFDDGTRWCANCDKTVHAEADPDNFAFAFSGKKCEQCDAIWPEYVEEFLDGFEDDPLYQAIFGIGETLH